LSMVSWPPLVVPVVLLTSDSIVMDQHVHSGVMPTPSLSLLAEF
jgi:hypothetical protein